MVRGVSERLITHLSTWSLHVWGLLELPLVGIPCVVWVATVLVEGVGAMGVAGTLKVVEGVEDLGEKLDGTFGCLLFPNIIPNGKYMCPTQHPPLLIYN